MKKPVKQFLSLFLIVLFLLTAASCGGGEVSAPSGGDVTSAEAVTETATESSYPAPDVAGLDFGGAGIMVSLPDWGLPRYYFTEELDGDPVNDAAYHRTSTVSDKLNVSFDWIYESADVSFKTVSKSIMAGDDAYQMVFTHSVYGLVDYLTGHCLYDLDDLPYVDFAAPWWNMDLIETYRLGGNVYYAAGDLTIPSINGILFNKSIAEEFNLPDHYQTVRDGKWTMDLMFEQASKVPEDINGDGVMDASDRTGFSGDIQDRACDFHFAGGGTITKPTENGFELVFWNEKTVDIYEKCFNFFMVSGNSQAFIRSVAEGQYFDEGLSLYTAGSASSMINLRDSDIEFGMLPYPKYNEAQDNYATYAWPCFVCVPTTIRNDEMVGAVLELFCYNSKELYTEYNETLVRGKSVRDAESLEMIDIICGSGIYDPCCSYLGFDSNFHHVFYACLELFKVKDENLASHYQKYEAAIQKSMDSLYESIMENVE